MKQGVKFTGRTISFELLISILSIQYLRVKVLSDREGKLKELIAIDFLAVFDIQGCVFTKLIYNVRFDSYWETQLLKVISKSNLHEAKAEGYHDEDHFKIKVGDDKEYKYYDIEHFMDVLNQAVFQRAYELEVIESDSFTYSFGTLIMIRKDSIIDYIKNPDLRIPYIKNHGELDYERTQEKLREENQNYWDDLPDNNWMDNPDDYWNID